MINNESTVIWLALKASNCKPATYCSILPMHSRISSTSRGQCLSDIEQVFRHVLPPVRLNSPPRDKVYLEPEERFKIVG